MYFRMNSFSGSRLLAPISPLGRLGPDHHAIIIGQSMDDSRIYVAEQRTTGYQLSELTAFCTRYSTNGSVLIKANDGNREDIEVVRSALREIEDNSHARYHLLVNNCESYSNRAMYGHSISYQIVIASFALLFLFTTIRILRRA